VRPLCAFYFTHFPLAGIGLLQVGQSGGIAASTSRTTRSGAVVRPARCKTPAVLAHQAVVVSMPSMTLFLDLGIIGDLRPWDPVVLVVDHRDEQCFVGCTFYRHVDEGCNCLLLIAFHRELATGADFRLPQTSSIRGKEMKRKKVYREPPTLCLQSLYVCQTSQTSWRSFPTQCDPPFLSFHLVWRPLIGSLIVHSPTVVPRLRCKNRPRLLC
jgi:hypothetical protein